MIRALVIVAVAGMLMSLVFITGAVALGGPDALARGAFVWNWDRDWDIDDERAVWRHGAGPASSQSSLEYAWTGDRLEINAPAEIDFVQAAGPAKLIIHAPADLLQQVRVEGGRISLSGASGRWAKLHVSLTAPDVRRFELIGAERLTIRDYKQDELSITASGRADIRGQGETRSLRLEISGHGEADLGDLKSEGAEIEISGAGEATVNPSEWARVEISGLGEVELLQRPKRLETDIAGAGRVRQPDASAAEAGDDEGERGPRRPA